MIENFINYKKNTNCNVGSYHCYPLMGMTIGQGADGYFIKLSKLNNFMEYYNIIKDYDYINYHDDYYISYFFYLKNEKIFHISYSRKIWSSHNNNNALCDIKGKYERSKITEKIYYILLELKINKKFDLIN